jgi:hypothetical protein
MYFDYFMGTLFLLSLIVGIAYLLHRLSARRAMRILRRITKAPVLDSRDTVLQFRRMHRRG